MNLLDDARRLAAGPPPREMYDGEVCLYCRHRMIPIVDREGNVLDPQPHAPDCPWLSMPRIVAALEMLERVVALGEPASGVSEDYCPGCRAYRPCEPHDETCLLALLASALRGDEVTA